MFEFGPKNKIRRKHKNIYKHTHIHWVWKVCCYGDDRRGKGKKLSKEWNKQTKTVNNKRSR